MSNGSELASVQSVELKAEAGGVWKAVITVLPEIIQPVSAEAEIVMVEVTALADESRVYKRAEV